MDFDAPPDSLVADFHARAHFDCTLIHAGTFGDLLWPPMPSLLEIAEYAQRDPAFVVEGFSRYVALARVGREIRYFAMHLGNFLEARGIRSGDRYEAALRDNDAYEGGVLPSLNCSLEFVDGYLSGAAFVDIHVARRVAFSST